MAWVSNPSRNIINPQRMTIPYCTAPMWRELMNAGTSKTSWLVLTSVVLMASIAIIVIDLSKTRQVVQRHRPEQCRTAQKDRRKTDWRRGRRISRNPAVRCGSSEGFHRQKPASRRDRFDLSAPRDGPVRWLPANRRRAPATNAEQTKHAPPPAPT